MSNREIECQERKVIKYEKLYKRKLTEAVAFDNVLECKPKRWSYTSIITRSVNSGAIHLVRSGTASAWRIILWFALGSVNSLQGHLRKQPRL